MSEFKGDKRVPVPIEVNFSRSIGATFCSWRTFRGFTLKDFVAENGRLPTSGYVSSFENGKIAAPNDDYLRRFSQTLGISSGYLLLRVIPEEATFLEEQPESSPSSRLATPDYVLDALFPSEARKRVLKLFFGGDIDEAHELEIVRLTGLEINAARRELANLTEGRILTFRREQNRVIYSPVKNADLRSKLDALFGKPDQIDESSGENEYSIQPTNESVINWDLTPGKAAKAWMEFRGFRQKDLVKILKMNDGYLSLVLNGRVKNPNDELIRSLATALDISPAYLLLRQTPNSLGLD